MVRRKTSWSYLIYVLFAVFLVLAMILIIPNSQWEGTRVQGSGAADGKLIGLHVYQGYSAKIPSSEWQWIRNYKLEVSWGSIEKTPGVLDWVWLDSLVNDFLSDGAESIYFLIGGPTPVWARDNQYGSLADRGPPRNLGDWYDFCSALAQRYGPVVDFYEIWNEPGWDRDSIAYQQWSVYHFGGQVETDYLPMLQLAYAAIKERDPSASVISGAFMCSVKDDPDSGTELYGQLFDDVSRPGQDVSIKVDANKPITAKQYMYFNYNGARNSGNGSTAAPSLQTEWYFEEGHTQPGYITWLCLLNPGDETANVRLDYYCGDGTITRKEVVVDADSRSSILVNQESLGIGQHDSTHGDISIKASSDQPIVAERDVYLFRGDWNGRNESTGASSPQSEWYFAEGRTGSFVHEYLCLQNPHTESAEITLTFMMAKGEVFSRKLTVPPGSSVTQDINQLIGFRGSCDMVAVHTYKRPEFWGPFYANVVTTLRSIGVSQEVVNSEVGWPSYSDTNPGGFNESNQVAALGEVGVKGLFDNGCKKIWIYRDIDENPGTVWDGNYYGLFKYTGEPHPAWYTYVQWQQQLPLYPLLPSSLP
jgi:hypothetical protein